MPNPLVKQTQHGHLWPLTASDVRALFGVGANASLPLTEQEATYWGPRGKVNLSLLPRTHPLVNSKILRPHRVFATCPCCIKLIPFGRMAQHYRRKDHAPC